VGYPQWVGVSLGALRQASCAKEPRGVVKGNQLRLLSIATQAHGAYSMNARFEYKFVRLGEGWLGVNRVARDGYRDEIQKHARDGWRLVQIFAPGVGGYGAAKYYELVLERPLT
jgi:hypothetical protein